VIDGINRFLACQMAGVEPKFTVFEGDEMAVKAFILSNNIQRRHLSKAQKAILMAIAYPDPEQGERSTSTETVEVHAHTLSQARCIVRWAPGKVEDILAGAQVFTKAFEEADKERERATKIAEHMAFLEREAPGPRSVVRPA
jgi:hypothetical protein